LGRWHPGFYTPDAGVPIPFFEKNNNARSTLLHQEPIRLPAVKGRKVRIEFRCSHITSDARAHLLRLVDRRLGLTEQLAGRLPDDRVAGRCTAPNWPMPMPPPSA